MQVCLFESIHYERLEPLIFPRPVYNLVCGINSLRAKIVRAYPDVEVSFHCRPYIIPFLREKYPMSRINNIKEKDCLFINGAVLPNGDLSEIIPLQGEDKLYVNNDTIVAARISGKRLEQIKGNFSDLLTESDFGDLPIEKVEIKTIDYVWDLINNNVSQMTCDYDFLTKDKKDLILGKVYDGAWLLGKERIFIDEGAVIKPGAVLDATKGPIYIDKGAIINPNSSLEGPLYIGADTLIKSGASIYDGVSIGKTCKVGGEVEDTVILPYTNKQHAGFIGHAYLGSWVNIGADTNCSDLKNNYGHVKIYVSGEIVDSGTQFLGVMIGDHTKTAINTMFNTGTVVGFSCNIFGAGFPAKYLPSFSWGGSDAVTTYDIERSIETGKRAMLRRNKKMLETEERLFRKVFDLTKMERRKRGYPY